MTRVKVFVSYSRLNKEEKEAVCEHLRVLVHAGKIDLWDDERIEVGNPNWRQNIDEALREMEIAVLLLTVSFINSKFIQETELPQIRARWQNSDPTKNDLLVVPVILQRFDWKSVDWIEESQLFNKGVPLFKGKSADADDLTRLTEIVSSFADKLRGRAAAPAPAPQPKLSRRLNVLFITARPERDEAPARRRHLLTRWLAGKKGAAPPPPPQAPPGPALPEMVRAEIEARPYTAVKFSAFEARGGVVVYAPDEPHALVAWALYLPTELKHRGVPEVRIGLHSVEVGGEAASEHARPPGLAVETARRLAEIGHAGHILASPAMRDAVVHGADPKSLLPSPPAELFREQQPRKLWPEDEPAVVYSVVRGAAGAPGPPREAVPERVIRHIDAPRTLMEEREESLKVVFWHDLSFVEIKFEYAGAEADGIHLSCEGQPGSDNTFEFDFHAGDNRERAFSLTILKSVRGESLRLKPVCRDEYGKVIGRPFVRPIKVRRSTPLWLWDKFWLSSPPVVRAAAALALCFVLYNWVVREDWKDKAKARLYWTDPMTQVLNQGFSDSENPSEQWEYSGGEMRFEQGGSGPGDGALVIDGSQRFTLNPGFLKSNSVYDFTANFGIKFKRMPAQARWVFRGQPDNKRGYVFTLDLNEKGYLSLRGETHSCWFSPYPIDSHGTRPVDFSSAQYDLNDWVEITAWADGYEFTYKARIISGTIGKGDTNMVDITPQFKDKRRKFRYGNLGIWQPENSTILLDFWSLYDVRGVADPKPTPTPQAPPAEGP